MLSSQIHIVEAMGLSLLEREVEAEVDDPLSLHLASHTTAKDGRHLPFTVCHRLPFEVLSTGSSFVALPSKLHPLRRKYNMANLELKNSSKQIQETAC